jgi:hypothetical protein
MSVDDAALTGIRSKEYVHHVTFRLNDHDAALAADLRSTFPNNTWAETYRWVMNDPVIVERIKQRIRGER